MELIRYIQLNPVRSGLNSNPKDYQFSGHRAYLGIVTSDWLTTDWILQRFSKKRFKAIKEYEKFVLGRINSEYQKEFHPGNRTGIILGDDKFITNLREKENLSVYKKAIPLDLSDISQWVCDYFEISEAELMEKARTRLPAKLRSYITILFTEHSGSILSAAQYLKGPPQHLADK